MSLPQDTKAIPTRLVFKKKRREDSTTERFKARLVVKGYLYGHVEGNYSPVVDFRTIRTALAVAAERHYHIHQMDVRTAFLHGEIDQELYVLPPPGLNLCKQGQSMKLKKGLYGLKQAPRLWNSKWKEVMNRIGFEALKSDECVFRRGSV